MQHGFVTLNNHHHNSRDLATRRKKSGAIHASLQHMPNKILGIQEGSSSSSIPSTVL